MFAVVFEVNPRPEAWDDYIRHAGLLRPELVQIDGFILNERYRSQVRPGWLVSLSLWRDEKAVIRWRTHALHHDAQVKGRAGIFADYHLRVGEVAADTGAAEPLPQQRFDATEVSPDKALSLTSGGNGPDGAEAFDSIADAGNRLYLRGWSDPDSAITGLRGVSGRHRIVRVIRDYGMFARAEAPQHFAT